MARDGMANLIVELRRLTNAGTADHTVAGVAYWTDDQLQEILDKYRTTHKRVSLSSDPSYEDGDYKYREYPIPAEMKNFEEAGADSGWALRDGDGVAVGTALYSVNYDAGMITFAADQDAEIYYLDARTYNVYRAAADVWDTKTTFYENYFDWSSDNHSVKQRQQVDNAKAQAKKFRSLAGPMYSRRVRVDERRLRRRTEW